MLARTSKLLLTAAALCAFSLSSIAAEATTNSKQVVKTSVKQGAEKNDTHKEKPAACKFRISTA